MNWIPSAVALAALLHVSISGSAAAESRIVSPVGNSSDFGTVQRVMAELSPGDTLILNTGLFDWSANITDSTSGLRGGLSIPVSRLTILGRKGAILRGAQSTQGGAFRMNTGTNAAFKNGPAIDDVTISGLTFEFFENAVVLLQGDSLSWATPVGAYRAGTRGWTLKDLSIRSGPFGISASGRHVDLTIRGCRFDMIPAKAEDGRDGSYAISVRPLPPAYGGLPERVVIEDNVIFGPVSVAQQFMHAGLILTADQSVVKKNSVERFGMGLVVEGRAMEVTENRLSRCGLGIVAWTTARLGTATEGARIARNEIRSMSRRNSGFLSEFSGSGILVAGITRSTIADNIVSANAGADIVFGAVRSTPPSSGNTVTGNGGVVLISKQSLEENTVEGSTMMVRDRSNPGEKKTPPKKNE